MIDYLNKYLFQHSSINIPGLGTIIIEKVPARTDFIARQIFPPQFVFRFDKYFDTPDKEFFSYLSASRNIPDYEAIQEYNEFAQEIRSLIKQEGKAEWKDVGVFRKDSSGEIEFEQLPVYSQIYAPVAAERVIRTDTSHAIMVGDQEKTSIEMSELLNEDNKPKVVPRKTWPVYAAVLFAVALIILFAHFYQHGLSWESIGNRQPFELKQQTR